MSDEIKTEPIPLTPAPTSKWAKLKKWWPSIPTAASLAILTGVLWPSGKAKQDDTPPLLVIYSGLQTNWDATVQSSHDPRLPVTVLTLTNGALATNMNNVNVRRAEIYRTSLVGFKGPDGSIVPVGQAAVILGAIAQTNGVDSTVFSQLRTNR
jgi:hypothetical protein